MAYFLKKTNNKKGTYLQIYESYYDPERKGGAHRSYKPNKTVPFIISVSGLVPQGIRDADHISTHMNTSHKIFLQ